MSRHLFAHNVEVARLDASRTVATSGTYITGMIFSHGDAGGNVLVSGTGIEGQQVGCWAIAAQVRNSVDDTVWLANDGLVLSVHDNSNLSSAPTANVVVSVFKDLGK